MKVLVCIDNNLKSDSRLKRHVTAIAKQADSVCVLTNTCPEDGFGLHIKNVRQLCFEAYKYQIGEWTHIYQIRETAKELGIYKELSYVFPFLADQRDISYYTKEVMDAYASYLAKKERGHRFDDITKRTAQEMEQQPAMSYVIIFLLNSIYMAKKAMQVPADVVLCNDIDTLLCGIVHKNKYGSRLIYDIHDITCDISVGMFPLIYSEMLMLYEKTLIQKADVVMGVGNYLLHWIRLHYSVKVPCVPIYSCNAKLFLQGVQPKKYKRQQVIRIYFHGYAFAARKLENIVLAAQNFADIQIVLRTNKNEYVEKVVKTAQENGMQDRLLILPMVPTEDVVRKANEDGDIGIYASVPDGSVNWQASFTNKFMEYLGAGLPVITTMAKDQMDVVSKYACGFLLKGDSVADIEAVFEEVLQNRENLDKMSYNSWKTGREVFDWDKYQQYLLDVIWGRDLSKCSLEDVTKEQKWQMRKWDLEDRMHMSRYQLRRRKG